MSAGLRPQRHMQRQSLSWQLAALFAVFLVLGLTSADPEGNNLVLFADVSLANRNESFDKIKTLPIKTFEFKYDKVPGRRQVGVLAVDAHRYFPESVEVVPQHNIPGKVKNTFITLNNFPIVDKNVIFMHGLVALQELLHRFDGQSQHIDALALQQEHHLELFKMIETALNASISEKAVENKKLFEIESKVRERRQELELKSKESEKEIVDEQLKNERDLLEYEESLARNRLSLQEQLARENAAAAVNLEKELASQREALRVTNMNKLVSLKSVQMQELESKKAEFEIEKIKAEVEAKAQQERANEDIAIRKLQIQSKLDTMQMVEGVKAISEQLSNLLQQFLSRPKQIAMVIGAVALILFSYNLFCQFVIVLRSIIQSKLGRPKLVRETSFSRSILPAFVDNILANIARSLSSSKAPTERILPVIEATFADVILESDAKERVLLLAQATRNTKLSQAPYRHVLLHGPPGTGKTLIARKLAQCSNMDYAIMSGGDVGPLGEQAVDQLNELFRWASRSKRGLLLFIDEAEAFLSTRKSNNSDDDSFVRHALNVLLYQTGTQSRHLMLVLATNRPGDLDPAVLDRIDLSMYIGLPALPERISLVRLYVQLHVVDPITESQNKFSTRMGWTKKYHITDECVNDTTIESIAQQCDGFSGREISKLCIAAFYAMLLTPDLILTGETLRETVHLKVMEHLAKRGFGVQQPLALDSNSSKMDTTNGNKLLLGTSITTNSTNVERRKSTRRVVH